MNSEQRHLSAFVMTLAVTCLLAIASGCQRKPGELFPTLERPIVWPTPPETPRIQYVGQIVTNADLKPGKSFGASIGEALFGKSDSLSMLTPQAICVDDRDRLFVADGAGQMIHVFDLKKRTYERWKPDPDRAVFAQPVALAWDSRQHLLVSDAVSGVIHVLYADGKWLGAMGGSFLTRPCGIAIDRAHNRIFVADCAAHQVIVMSPDGELIQRIGTRGTHLGDFNFPTNVAVDATGRLYVSDTLNFRVQVFDSSLRPILQIGRQGDMPGYFSQPKGIALDSDGHIYVVDARFEAVQIFDAAGQLLLSFGEEGTDAGQFWLPNGICIDSTDRIWVADSYNRRVQVFQYLGEASP